MKDLWKILAIAVFGFIIGGLLCRPNGSLERAEFERDSLRVVVDSQKVLDDARAVRDRAAADSDRHRDAAIAALDRRADSLEKAQGNVVVQINTFPDLVPRRLVDNLLAIQAEAKLTWQHTRDSLKSELLTARRQKAEADTAATKWRGIASTLQASLDRAISHGRWGCTVGPSVTAGGAIAGNLHQASAGFGGSIGIGATCGRKFL